MIRHDLYTGTIYIFDNNAIKELLDRYPKEIFPSIWSHVNTLLQNGSLYSHIEVLREIKQTTDLKDKALRWSKKHRKIFLDIDDCQINQIQMIKSKYDQQYWQTKMNRPGAWADPYLIAIAKCENATIVTEENKFKPNNIPPIATLCGVRSLKLLELFQELKIKL